MIDHIPADDLSARLDDALTPARRDQVDAHLASCADCRAELDSLRWVTSFSRALPQAEMPEGLQLRLPEEEIREEAEPGSVIRFPAWRSLAAMAAMLTLAFMLGRLGTGGSDLSGSGASLESADVAYEEAAEAAVEFEAAAEGPEALLDIDDAADLARSQSEPDSDAEAMLKPLATAITGERSRTGERGSASLGQAAAPGSAGTATAAAGDSGGYRPPGAPVPGADSARDGSAPYAATASAITAARATAESALALLKSVESPDGTGGGGMSPESLATLEAARAMQPESTVVAAGTALAGLLAQSRPATQASSESAQTPVADALGAAAPAPNETAAAEPPTEMAEIVAPAPAAALAEAGETAADQGEEEAAEDEGEPADRSEAVDDVSVVITDEDEDTAEDAEAMAVAPADEAIQSEGATSPAARSGAPENSLPSGLFIPLAAISIGLLALGTLFLRQGLRRRRRRRHLDL